MNNHMIVLATKFLHEIKGFAYDAHGMVDCNAEYKKKVMNDIGEILTGGSLTAEQLNRLIDKTKEQPQEQKDLYYSIGNILEHLGVKYERKSFHDPENLIVPGNFYYHPRLQVVPPPPRVKLNLQDGTFESSYEQEPFFLEMIEKITIRDLIEYFYRKTNSTPPDNAWSKDKGAFEHLLKFWDVDFILYLIDEAFTCSFDDGKPLPKSPLECQHFDTQALGVYEARKNTCFEEGLDRVRLRGN